MQITIHQVAEKAGVSVSTASRILNGGTKGLRRDALKRAELVLKTAEGLGYRPNAVARGLVMKRTWTVGFIGTEINNPVRSRLIETLRHLAQQNGLQLLVSGTGHGENIGETLNAMTARRVDGLILAGIDRDRQTGLQSLIDSGFPLVEFGHSDANTGNRIFIDYFELTRQLTRHLAENHGLKDIVFAGLSGDYPRCNGYRQGMRECGLEQHIHFWKNEATTLSHGREITRQRLAVGDRPQAIIAHNDLTAIGVMAELRDHGLRVPEDVAVIGHDNIEMASYTNPTLTSAGVNSEWLSQTLFDRLLELIESPGAGKFQQLRCEGEIFHRESCGCINRHKNH